MRFGWEFCNCLTSMAAREGPGGRGGASPALSLLRQAKLRDRRLERLGICGMREDYLAHILHPVLHLDHGRCAGDELAAAAADHVDAENLSVLLAHENLHRAALAFVLDHEPARNRHRQDRLLVGNALRLQFVLSGADLRDFRMRVDDGRNRAVAHPVRDAEHVVDGDDAFACGGVR